MRSQFPTKDEVGAANVEQVLRWNRTLPTAQDAEELAIINRNYARLRRLQLADPEAYSRASKKVGWPP